jgi:hypothetical protein
VHIPPALRELNNSSTLADRVSYFANSVIAAYGRNIDLLRSLKESFNRIQIVVPALVADYSDDNNVLVHAVILSSHQYEVRNVPVCKLCATELQLTLLRCDMNKVHFLDASPKAKYKKVIITRAGISRIDARQALFWDENKSIK